MLTKKLFTTKRIPASIRNTIHEKIIETISEEFEEFRQFIYSQKMNFYDIDIMSIDQLINLSKTLNVPFSTEIFNDDSFIREEVRSIPFKIFNKGTALLYKSFAVSVKRLGELFVYTYRSANDDIFRSTKLPYENAWITHPSLPFLHSSANDFSGRISSFLTLDSDPLNYFDIEENIWRLDTEISEVSTNHLGYEYFIDRIITRTDANQTKEFLMTKEYLNYLKVNFDFGRRLKEVIHIGSQLSIQIDDSGKCNSFDMCYKRHTRSKYYMGNYFSCDEHTPKYICRNCEFAGKTPVINNETGKLLTEIEDGVEYPVYEYPNCFYRNGGVHSEYTIPSLKLKAIAHPNYFNLVKSAEDIVIAEFGIGTGSSLPLIASEEEAHSFPTNLGQRIITTPIIYGNQFDNNLYRGALAEYTGQSISNYDITSFISGEFDGVNQIFEFDLPFAPIQKGNITLTFHTPDEEAFVVLDDGKGRLTSLKGNGFIDYTTGRCKLTTDFRYSLKENINLKEYPGFYTEGGTLFEKQLDCFGYQIIPESVWLIFVTGEDFAVESHRIADIPDEENSTIGRFIHNKIDYSRSYVNYETGEIRVKFTETLVDYNSKKSICQYILAVNFCYPVGTKLQASYFFTQDTINITEVGFRNREGILVSYATFPPIEFLSSLYHFNFLLLVRKPDLANSNEEDEEEL